MVDYKVYLEKGYPITTGAIESACGHFVKARMERGAMHWGKQGAQNILDIRVKYADSSLADLYDPTTMPPDLIKAHQKLDSAVDKIYAKKRFNSDAERVALLFQLYQELISPLQIDKEKPVKKRRRPRRY